MTLLGYYSPATPADRWQANDLPTLRAALAQVGEELALMCVSEARITVERADSGYVVRAEYVSAGA